MDGDSDTLIVMVDEVIKILIQEVCALVTFVSSDVT